MSHPTISIRNVSKKYRLGVVGMTTLRDELQRRWAKLRGNELAFGDKKRPVNGARVLGAPRTSPSMSRKARSSASSAATAPAKARC